MLREMRKKERSINISEAMEILNEGQYGVLSVITNEGYPMEYQLTMFIWTIAFIFIVL